MGSLRAGVGIAAAGVVAALLPVATLPASASTTVVVPGSVVIDELHYHDPVDTRDFLELHNPGETAVDLSGACFTVGIGGCFPTGTSLAPGAFLVAADTPADLATAFPAAPVPALDYTGALSNGGERVTLTAADGTTVLDTVAYDDAAPWPLTPDGDGPSLELTDPAVDNDAAIAWLPSDPAPTPGATNSRAGQGPLPVVTDLAVGPVAAGQPISITATVSGAASADLDVVVDFGPPQLLPMADDGAHGDGAAGDGTWGATLQPKVAGTLIRYRVRARSTSGTTTLPAEGEERARRGFVVAQPPVSSTLPVLHWRLSPAAQQALIANKFTNDYQPAVITFGNEVWDGVEVRVNGSPKNRRQPHLSYKFKMPKDHPLVAPGLVTSPVDEFVLDADVVDATGATALLSYGVYADSNPLVPQRGKAHVRRNGAFDGLYTFLEEPDDGWRERAGLDGPGDEVYEPEGDLGLFVDEGSPAALVPRFEKTYPDDGDLGHLHELVQAIDAPPTEARAARLRDLFDVPALADFLAVGAIVQHWDSTVHNFILVRDGETGRWRFVPADQDQTLGLPMGGPPNAPTGARISAAFPYGPADLVSALRSDPVFAPIYFRRLRSLADRYLAGGEIQARADALAPTLAADLQLELAAWPRTYTAAQGRAQLSSFLAYRNRDLLTTRRVTGEVPTAPTPGLRLVITEVAPAATGGAAHDFVELHNPSPTEALDVSGWAIAGAATAVLPPGTVVPAGGHLVVPGDQEASAPDRPSGTLVAGELAQGVADAGGTLTVTDAGGAVRSQTTVGVGGAWPTAPATGLATLELVDPSTDGVGPASWRASATAAGSPGSSDVAAAPLVVEAAADNVEELLTSTTVGLTVAVTNASSTALPAVAVTGPGTTCARSLGTLAPGAATVFRCATVGPRTANDRSHVVTATSGATTARSGPVQIRTLRHNTNIFENDLLGPPTSPRVLLGAGGATSLTWTRPPGTAQPQRWTVVTGLVPGRATPTVGALLPPTTGGTTTLAVDQAVRLALAARNTSGTGPRTALTPWLVPRAATTWPFPSADAQARRLFLDLQGRAPTNAEAAALAARLAAATSPATVIADLLTQPRWSVDVAPVARLYAAYFGRLPDQAGLAYWVGRRRAGAGLDPMSSAFAATSEFAAAYGPLDYTGFVTRVYRNVLGRAPDPAGLSYWRGRLAAGRTRGQVMTAFSESSEGIRTLAPLTGTSLVWTALLGTTPTAAVAEPSRTWLAGGGSLATVVEGVRTSDAYATHVAP